MDDAVLLNTKVFRESSGPDGAMEDRYLFQGLLLVDISQAPITVLVDGVPVVVKVTPLSKLSADALAYGTLTQPIETAIEAGHMIAKHFQHRSKPGESEDDALDRFEADVFPGLCQKAKREYRRMYRLRGRRLSNHFRESGETGGPR